MATAPHSITMSRRTAIAGAAAMVATPAAAAVSPSAGDSAFAAKCQIARRAWAEVDVQSARNEAMQGEIGKCPSLPDCLLEPLCLPGHDEPGVPGEAGWHAETLAIIVTEGRYFTVKGTNTEHGWESQFMWLPVTPETRRKAAELLPVRQAYDSAREAWRDRSQVIEDVFAELVQTADALIRDLVAYPVFTLPEVKQKLAILESSSLLECVDEGGEIRKALLRDALAVAEKAVRNG